MAPQIIVFGSLNIDLVSVVKRHPDAGETVHGSSYSTLPGGKGSNQAAACARWSRTSVDAEPVAKVSMLGCIGKDKYGPILTKHLADSGCDVSAVLREGDDTGVAVITVEEATGENRIIVHALANSLATDKLFPSLPFNPDLLLMQLEIPFETVVFHAKLAKEHGTKVMLNPSPVRELPDELLQSVTYLVVNETEAAFLAGVPLAEKEEMEQHFRASDAKMHPWLSKVGENLLDRGCKYVIVTLGKLGAVFGSRTNGFGIVHGVQVPKVVDTTGAGDAFTGALAVELVTQGEQNIGEAVAIANKAAAVMIQRPGAGSAAWRDEHLRR